jgi:hypothetical protein
VKLTDQTIRDWMQSKCLNRPKAGGTLAQLPLGDRGYRLQPGLVQPRFKSMMDATISLAGGSLPRTLQYAPNDLCTIATLKQKTLLAGHFFR